jgi:hypothetical protein
VVSTAGRSADTQEAIRSAILELGLSASALAKRPDVPVHDVDLPRLAVYSTWGSTQDVGWVRHAFDTFSVTYDLIFKERVRKGDLARAYDVIVIPNQGRNARAIVLDIEPKGKPLAYTKTDRFKYLGEYGESEDITGGMGLEGVSELQTFVEQGGLLITMGGSSALPPEFGILRRIETHRPSAQFYAPGPIVPAEILKTSHPIFYGYPDRIVPVRYANGPILQVPQEDRASQVLMQFSGSDNGVLSGLMKGAAEILNRPAIVEVPAGRGRVILFSTNPVYRWQNLGEFNMLFNAMLHHNDSGGVLRSN